MPGRTPSRRIPLSLGAAAVIITCYTLAGAVAAIVPGLDGAGRTLAVGVLLGCLAGVAAWLATPRLVAAPPPRLPDPPITVTHPETQRLLHRLRFDRQLYRALDDAHDEHAVHDVTARALELLPPQAPGELLLVGGKGRLVQVSEAGPDGEGPGCPVADQGDCAAIRHGRTMRFGSRDDLDACRHLVDRDSRPCAAVCVPLRVAGQPAGVLHRVAADPDAPNELEVSYVETLAAAVEARLTVLRVAGGTDPATAAGGATSPGSARTAGPDGPQVLDHDALRRAMADLSRSLRGFALARCDIDHLTDYAERHGEPAAERARAVLAEAAGRCVRPDDLVGEGGGADLLLVFPDTDHDAAAGALERLREEIALACNDRELPPFTVSFGVVASSLGRQLDELLDQVDVATARAKHLGRNRVSIGEGDDDRLGS